MWFRKQREMGPMSEWRTLPMIVPVFIIAALLVLLVARYWMS